MPIQLRDKSQCQYDLISLGEIMLRFDPGEGRIRTARRFNVWEGGGEYNVARGLRRCFGLKTAVCTAFADNDIGQLLEDFILQGGVGTEFIKWAPFDSVGRVTRNGLNFTERGFGVRGALGISDRGHTAASQLKPGDFDWDHIFGKVGVRWLHTGGIFAALSDTTPLLIVEAAKKARQYGTIVSYDSNYRPSLWKSNGGWKRAQEVNREIAKYMDVMIGNPVDFIASFSSHDKDTDANPLDVDVAAFKKTIKTAAKEFPNLKAMATTLRTVKTATVNDWAAIAWMDGKFYESRKYPGLEILDRVGGGDGFASGFIYGLMTGGDPQKAVEYGTVHGALAMTTPGDASMADVKEVEKMMKGGGTRAQR